jgi:hypothetical protein
VSATGNSFQRALETLARAQVDFVIVGVGGINFYAREPGEMILTQDLDLLLAPRVENVRSALEALAGAGFSFSASGEPFVDFADPIILENLIRNAASVTAHHPSGVQLDLMLSASGFRYEELADDAEAFRLGDMETRVGRLEKLLHSKERAGRPKDLEFLRLYAARLRSPRE